MNAQDFRKGVIPGILSGYIFLAYAGGGMQDMIGGMIDSNDFVGFILHIVFSAVIGGLYTALFTRYVNISDPLINVVIGGLIYGIIWWVVGGNLIMPLIAGGDVFQFEIGASFYGHIIFGHTLAAYMILRNIVMADSD